MDYKIRIPNKTISKAVQEKLFSEGSCWPHGGRKHSYPVLNLHINNRILTRCITAEYFDTSTDKEILWSDYLEHGFPPEKPFPVPDNLTVNMTREAADRIKDYKYIGQNKNGCTFVTNNKDLEIDGDGDWCRCNSISRYNALLGHHIFPDHTRAFCSTAEFLEKYPVPLRSVTHNGTKVEFPDWVTHIAQDEDGHTYSQGIVQGQYSFFTKVEHHSGLEGYFPDWTKSLMTVDEFISQHKEKDCDC